MKKIILIIALFMGVIGTGKAQVLFNTAQTLQGGKWNIGINPMYGDRGADNFALFFHGGYGLGNNSDLGMKLGFGWGHTYFGMDYEKSFNIGKPSISIGGGAHYWNYFGLDATVLFTFPINNLKLTTGLDINAVFGKDNQNSLEMWVPVYLPLNFEVMVTQNIGVVFEGNILLNQRDDRWYYHHFTTVGGGINIYF